MNLKHKLGTKILFFDGAMGSMLQGYIAEHPQLPEQINLTNPALITDIHKQYLSAGCDIITANTFGAYCTKFDNVEDIIAAAIKNARVAIDELGLQDKYVALDMGSVGKLLKPLGELAFDECYDIFKRSLIAGEKSGADFVLFETLSDTYEAKAAILAAKENTNLPIVCTMTFEETGQALTGADCLTMVALLEGLGVDALGINCGLGPKQIKTIFQDLIQYASIPILLQPNAGLPRMVDGKTTYDCDATEFSDYMLEFATSGAWLLGGCCGTTPTHIEKMVARCQEVAPVPIVDKGLTVVSSYAKAVILSKKPVVIGERINPTGKKKFKEALINRDMNYILNEAISQKDKGAHILDVNVGLPDIDEEQLMVEAVEAIQATVDLPLQIDSGTPAVIEAALRRYNGKPMVNSVNGKLEVMEKIFPIVKKYGGVVVGLTLDKSGIPKTAEGRLAIAKTIVDTAKQYGIDKKDIIIDTLTLTVSAEQEIALETVRALSLVRDVLGVKTILGVSNISFGLPNRPLINTTFFALALHAGLNACIVNPSSTQMMDTIHAYNVLACHDEAAAHYIQLYAGETIVKETTKLDLKEMIVKGMKGNSYDETVGLLKQQEPLTVVSDYIVPALDAVGAAYESKKVFLPQLIMSAETAKNSFRAIEDHLARMGVKQEKVGTVAIATVEGDIHDIGKNIVKALLENYGFEVMDLGKDVPIATIVDAVQTHQLKLVGLSALMTTTVVNMEKTIQAIRSVSKDCKVMVGGAVLNETYAKTIGADFYGKDALASVSYAQKVFVKGI